LLPLFHSLIFIFIWLMKIKSLFQKLREFIHLVLHSIFFSVKNYENS
jgi:hypothetical protein